MQFTLVQVFLQMTLLAISLGTGMSLWQWNLGWSEWPVVGAVFLLSAAGLMHGFRTHKQDLAMLALILAVGILGGLLAFRWLVFFHTPA